MQRFALNGWGALVFFFSDAVVMELMGAVFDERLSSERGLCTLHTARASGSGRGLVQRRLRNPLSYIHPQHSSRRFVDAAACIHAMRKRVGPVLKNILYKSLPPSPS